MLKTLTFFYELINTKDMKTWAPLLSLWVLIAIPALAQNLTPPSNVNIDQVSPSVISFSWEYPDGGQQGFIVERRQGQDSDYQIAANVAAGVMNYTDHTIENGKSYQYRVKAYNATEESPYSRLIEGPPAIKLHLDDGQKIVARKLKGILDISGVPALDYLRVSSEGKYGAIKLGYDEYAVYTPNPLILSGAGYEYLYLTVKDLAGTNWNRVEFRLNDKGGAIIGNYLNDADDLGDGWLRVKIPLSAFMEKQNVQFISFPNAFGGEFGLREVRFAGEEASFQWFGDKKYDNAFKENVVGQGKLVFQSAGIQIEEVRIQVLNDYNHLERPSMPYSPIDITLTPGENLLYAMMIDTNGTVYYSDTVNYTVEEGPVLQVTDVSCSGSHDGSIDLTMNGGVPPYTFQWSNGASSEDISGLAAGFYELNVTDSEGKKATVNAVVEQPNPLVAGLYNENCTDDTRLLKVTGGKAPYSYSIDNGPFQPINTSGAEVWRITGRENGWYKGLEEAGVDSEDNVYIAGNYSGVIYFEEDSVGVEGEEGIYLAGISAQGDFIWSVTFIGGRIGEMAVDAEGNTLLAFNLLYGDGTMITHNQEITLKENGYLARFNKKGYLDWIKVMPKEISNVGVDGMDNIYVAGQRTSAFFNGNEFNNIQGPSDLYLAKYTSQGNLIWARNLRGRNSEINEGMHISAAGDIYLTGGYETDIYFDDIRLQSTHHMDVYVARYNTHGQAMWATRGGGPNHDDFGRDITVTPEGKVYVIAHLISSSATFGEASFDQPVLLLANIDNTDGTIQWAKPYVLIEGYPTFDMAYDIKPGFNGDLYITGEMAWSNISNGTGFELYVGSYLLRCNADGIVQERKTLGDYTYGEVSSPVAITSDNHLIYSEHYSGLSIVKYGPAMQKEIQIDPELNNLIVVRDDNNCTFTIDDLNQSSGAEQPLICFVTADTEGGGNQLYWNNSSKTAVEAYTVYRAPGNSGNFKEIGTVSGIETTFVDNNVTSNKHSYTYKIGATDKCGIQSVSTAHKTMHLKVSPKGINQAHLSWEPYKGIEYDRYLIFRGAELSQMELLAEVPAHTFDYIDGSSFTDTLYYKVAIAGSSNCYIEQPSGVMAVEGPQFINSNVVASYQNHAANKNDILFYPNPGTDRVSLKFKPEGDQYQLTMVDNKGRVVRKIDGVRDNAVIDRGSLPPGIYSVVLHGNSGVPLRGVVVFQ